MKIGQLERITGTPKSTIRHYEKLGLLPACEVQGPKLHLYGPEHVTRLAEIKRLRGRGVALGDMKPQLSRVRSRSNRKAPANGTPRVRDEIIGAAARRLLVVGYHGLKLETLAKSLRIAKPTLYRYFASKQSLFLAAVNAMRLSLVPQKLRDQATSLDAALQSRFRARVVLENFVAYRGLYALLQTLTSDNDPVVAEGARQELRSMVTNAEPFLRGRIAEGSFRAFDSELLAYVLWGALMGTGEYMLRRPGEPRESVEELVSAYLSIIGRGVSTHP